MKELRAGVLVVKKSRFYAHLYEIERIDEIDEILKMHRKMYRKAVHHCWAVVLEDGTERFKDDGEVGHPGRVLLQVLKKHGAKNRAIVVSRVFGGVKLGVGGVSRAFRDAGEGLFVEKDNER